MASTTQSVQRKVPSTSKLTPQLEALARKWAGVFGAPVSLLLALMAIESGYNPRAKNSSARAMKGGGAWGLTQLLLRDARDLTARNPKTAAKYWPQWNKSGEGLLDPNTHLAIAAFKLAGNWRRYQARPAAWLTAGVSWHQGIGNVDKQVKAGGGRVLPAKLPPNGREYWARLETQQSDNPIVVAAINSERQQGAYA